LSKIFEDFSNQMKSMMDSYKEVMDSIKNAPKISGTTSSITSEMTKESA